MKSQDVVKKFMGKKITKEGNMKKSTKKTRIKTPKITSIDKVVEEENE